MSHEEYRSSALWTSTLNAGIGSLAAAIVIADKSLPVWPIATFVASGILGLAILVPWPEAPRRVCLAALQLNFATGLVTSAFTAQPQLRLGGHAEMFESIKMSLLVIALLAPSRRVGLLWLAAFALLPLIQTLFWPAGMRTLLPVGEPWVTVVFGLAAAGVLIFRRRAATLQRELVRARAERIAAARVARLSMAVRDLANSPLQTLSSGVELLSGEGRDVRDRMERALHKLHELGETLNRADEALGFRTDAFDAQAELEAALRRNS
jgi:hypothetical protein